MREESSSSQNVNLCIASCQRGTSQGSYRIFLEDGSSFFISVDFFLEHKLKKGQKVNEELLLDFKAESSFVETYLKALSLLRRQRYTTYNLKRKLSEKDFSSEAIDRAVIKLAEKGYLDDYDYACSWVSSRLKNKLDSYNSLLSGLQNKGISTNIAKEVLHELYNSSIERDIIKKSVDKYCRQGKTSDKIINALLRKGFNRKSVFYYVNRGRFDEGS